MDCAKSLALPMGTTRVGNLLQRQSAKMPMDGPVAAEDQRGVGLIGGIEFVAGKEVDARHLELPDVVVLGMKSQQGNGAHRATFAQATMKNKMRTSHLYDVESRIPASAGQSAAQFRPGLMRLFACQACISSADGPYIPGISISFSRR